MMDLLRQSQAPLTDAAWDLIHEEAGRHFKEQLTARLFVHVDGPHGLDYQALPLGSPQYAKQKALAHIQYGVYRNQPLVEARIPFTVSRREMDDVSRGFEEPDFEHLERAAKTLAQFEEQAVYHGFPKTEIYGLKDRNTGRPMELPKQAEQIPVRVQEGIGHLHGASIAGPYALVLPPPLYNALATYTKGYPIKPRIQDMLGGPIIRAAHSDYAFLLPHRSEDIRLVLGMDVSIGYESHDADSVQLYFMESFTFRVFNPDAVVMFQ